MKANGMRHQSIFHAKSNSKAQEVNPRSDENLEKEEQKLFLDYRLLVLFKHFVVGVADVCFWWTVWLISDRLYPMDITTDGSLTFARGYAFIIAGNIFYLLYRALFRKTFYQFYQKSEQKVYKTVILTIKTGKRQKRPIQFLILKFFFPIFVYSLVVGFINVWRGLFATFDYLVELLYKRLSVNRILSSVIFQLIVGITLAFTQKNNAVNLCPTHKIYKYDELEYLDGLFNLEIFSNFNEENESAGTIEDEEVITNSYAIDVEECGTASEKYHLNYAMDIRSSSSDPLDHEFDLVKFAAGKLMRGLHKPASPMSPEIRENDKSNKLWTAQRHQNTPLWHFLPPRASSVKWLDTIRTLQSQTRFSSDCSNVMNKSEAHVIEGNSEIDKSKSATILINVIAEGESYEDGMCQNNMQDDQTVIRPQSRHFKIEDDRKGHIVLSSGQDDCKNCWRCRFIVLFAYLYTIHHRHIFLHVFGGMFWSTTWKIYDYATQNVFNKTFRDFPGLVLIAFTCHCLNHMLLFKLKEQASTVRWKTFYEFFCGINTVCMWASLWYIWDILAALTGKLLIFQITMHFLSFGCLAAAGLSINTAL